MKKIITLLLVIASFNAMSFDLFGVFKEKPINPLTLKTFEERMDYLVNTDPNFKAWLKRQEERKKSLIEANEKVLKELENEWEMSKSLTPEEYERKRAEIKRNREHHLIQEQQELERKLLSEWKVVNDNFVNIKEEEARIARKKEEEVEMERVRKFQRENNIKETEKNEQIRINY